MRLHLQLKSRREYMSSWMRPPTGPSLSMLKGNLGRAGCITRKHKVLR